MTHRRRFHCSEADYLTDLDVPLLVAVQYATRYGPGSIARLHHAGITAEQANADPLTPEEVACRYPLPRAPS